MKWAKIIFKDLFKEIDKWTKVKAKMIERKGKLDVKKDMCNSTLVFKC
jgi:hypothetical protein